MGFVTPNILIVESDSRQTELKLELIKDIVRAQVDITNSGARALELVGRSRYQLAVVDCSIGDIHGLLILERIKRISPATSVILTSNFATIQESVKAMRLGADDYFKNPFDPEQFTLAVKRCLDRPHLFATGDQAVTGLMHLLNACQLISGCYEFERIFETVMGYVKSEISPKGCALFYVTEGSKTRIETHSDVEPLVVEVLVEGHGFLPVCLQEKHALKVIPRVGSTPEIAVFCFEASNDASPTTGAYFIVCIAPEWRLPLDEVGARFRLLQAQVQMTSKSIQNYQGVRHLLYLDEVSGLFNSRYMHICTEQLILKYQKNKNDIFSVLFIDLDKFKSINDLYGHIVGTKILAKLGAIIKSNTQKTDSSFRYGGDEFVILLPGKNSSEARLVAEKIRSEVERTVFLSKEKLNIRLTVSIGVAGCPEHAVTKKEIIETADHAMYSVKKVGRNKVYIADKKAA